MTYYNKRSNYLIILIPTYNRLKQLKHCIESITRGTSVSHEVVVIDGGSTDGTIPYLKSNKRATSVFQGKLLGPVKSENMVLRKLNCRYVSWLNDDQELLPGSLDFAISILDKDPAIGIVNLKMKDMIGPYTKYAYEVGFSEYGVLNSSNSVIRFPLFKSLGFRDERFYFYQADSDITTAVLCAGYKVVTLKNLCILHHREWSKNLSKEELDKAFKKRSKGIDGNDIYKRKYLFLEKYQQDAKMKHTIKNYLYDRYIASRQWGQNVLGLEKEYWTNLRVGRFVNQFDSILTWNKPYHLVQQIPKQILSHSDNPYLKIL